MTKRGDGSLTLAAANTYTGNTTIEQGLVRVTGSLVSPVVINGGALVGSGPLAGPVVLNEAGLLGVEGAGPGAVLSVPRVTWNSGARLRFNLGENGTSNRLEVSGALTRGGGGPHAVELRPDGSLFHGDVYTLATFGSTDFTADDFIAVGLPEGFAGVFSVSEEGLQVRIVERPQITSPGSASGKVGVAFAYNLTATHEPTQLSIEGLPAGLVFDPVSGSITGTPATAGNVSLVLRATNAAGTASAPLALVISKGDATVLLEDLTQPYDGEPKPVTATASPDGLDVVVTYKGSPAPPIYPGRYEVVATIADPNYAGTRSETLEVTITALLRHAPTLNGDVEGSVQVLLPENVTLNGGSSIVHDLLVPGLPTVRVNRGATYGSTLEGPGAVTPTSHGVTLNSSSLLSHVVRRVDPIAMPTVPAPEAPRGTRSVSINAPGAPIGDFATVRNLTLNSGAGEWGVPPGAYGTFTANGSSGFVLGTPGASEPAVYHLQSLTLNGRSSLRVVGPVILRTGNVTINGTLGTNAPLLTVESAHGSVTLNSGARACAVMVVPAGTVTLNGAQVLGRVVADRLVLNSNALLEEVP